MCVRRSEFRADTVLSFVPQPLSYLNFFLQDLLDVVKRWACVSPAKQIHNDKTPAKEGQRKTLIIVVWRGRKLCLFPLPWPLTLPRRDADVSLSVVLRIHKLISLCRRRPQFFSSYPQFYTAAEFRSSEIFLYLISRPFGCHCSARKSRKQHQSSQTKILQLSSNFYYLQPLRFAV